MKYFFLSLILILSSCSLDKNSTFWIDESIDDLKNKQKNSKNLEKNIDIKTMTFNEFGLFLKKYTKRNEYPDINN